MSNQDFLNKVIPAAQKTYGLYGIFPSVMIAQSINESGWGNSYLAQTDNNLFGIKYPGAKDPSLNITQGTYATDDGGYYRHYQSWNDSLQDFGYFLKNNSIYTDSGVFRAKTPEEQITAIKAAGYASDPNYVSTTMEIINDNNLTQYDTGTFNGGDSANSDSANITVEATNYQVLADSTQIGDVLFGRKYRITVSDANGNGLDVSQLRCTFNIIKTIQMEPNSSIITIYNLNAQTENSIIMNGKRVTVEAGYEGSQFGLIFDGDILQTIREREDGTTLKLTIVALDSDRAINFDISNFSIVKGQTQRSIVDHIINNATNPINIGSISEKLQGQTLARGKVVFGKTSDYLRQIAKSNNLQYYMDDGKLNLISLDELPEGEIFELTPTSGLIGTPAQTDYGVSGQCLLNPQIKLNSLIHIDNTEVRAKQIDINGSNAAPQGGTATASDDSSTISSGISGIRDKIIAEAKRLCDDPNVQYSEAQGYRNQTVNGITYYDCSSFVKHCYETAGLDLLDITTNQWQQVQAKGLYNIDINEAKAGDLVFWFENGEATHVAIYAGANDIYAARGKDGIAPQDQVMYETLYGDYKIGRPESLINADGGEFPSTNGNNDNSTNSQTLFRSLDKDGIYRVIKITYDGDTRGDSWYLNFETIDQLGGSIAAVTN